MMNFPNIDGTDICEKSHELCMPNDIRMTLTWSDICWRYDIVDLKVLSCILFSLLYIYLWAGRNWWKNIETSGSWIVYSTSQPKNTSIKDRVFTSGTESRGHSNIESEGSIRLYTYRFLPFRTCGFKFWTTDGRQSLWANADQPENTDFARGECLVAYIEV